VTTKYQIIYWRDIPAQVKVRAGRTRLGRPLSIRFEQAIDQAAMHAGLINQDDYLGEWRQTEWQERAGEPEAVAEALTAELEEAYTRDRLRELSRNGGREAAEG
jgi:hypothetical protein